MTDSIKEHMIYLVVVICEKESEIGGYRLSSLEVDGAFNFFSIFVDLSLFIR